MKDDIRSKFFVDSEDYIKNRIEEFAERIIKHCKVTNSGQIFIENQSISPDNKIKLALACRLIAHYINNNSC